MSSTWAAVSTGMANSSRNWVTSDIQVKTGIFIRVMPGARRLRMVAIRLTAPTSDEMPVRNRPMFQKSMPWLGEKVTPLFGA